MLTAVILICSVGVAPDLAHCTRSNARVVMSVPTEDGNPITCFMHAQAYLAETSSGRDWITKTGSRSFAREAAQLALRPKARFGAAR